MYIRDQRVRTRRALYQGGRGIAGLGDACSDMGGQTQSDGSCQIAIATSSGQSTSTSSWLNANANPTPSSSPAPSQSNAGFSDVLSATIGAVGKIFGSQPQPTVIAPSSGIDTTTLLVLGGLGLGAVLLLSRKGS